MIWLSLSFLLKRLKKQLLHLQLQLQKAKAKGSGSKSINLLNLQYDFSIASFISGIFSPHQFIITLESDKFETKLLRNQLIYDEINLDNIEKSKF